MRQIMLKGSKTHQMKSDKTHQTKSVILMISNLCNELKHQSEVCFEPLFYNGKYNMLFLYYFQLFIMIPDVFDHALNHCSQNESLNALLHQFLEVRPVDFTTKFDEIVDTFRNGSERYDEEDFFYDLLTNTDCSSFFCTNNRNC